MTSQALYLRWRPAAFEEVIGQAHVTQTLQNALTGNRVAHAYLFSGPRGTGKTTTARLLAKAVNCLHDDPAQHPCNACSHCESVNRGRFLDMIEIDAASHTGVDDVRELRDRVAFAPNEGRYKVYIIDEVHRFSGSAFDALLKTIEEPPPHAIFILATTEIHKVPQTIKSRCQRFDFHRIPLELVIEQLRQMIETEGLQAEDAALDLIARHGTGSLRDSISLLDQLLIQPDQMLTLQTVQAILGTIADEAVQALVDLILAGDAARGLELVNRVIEEGGDARQFAQQIIDYLRAVMLIQVGGIEMVGTALAPDELVLAQHHAQAYPRRALFASLRAFNDITVSNRASWQPQLPLEMALIESIDAIYQPDPEPATAPRQARPAQSSPASAHQEEAAPPPAQTQEPPPQPAADAPTVEMLHKKWGSVVQEARRLDRTAEALLKSGSVYGIEGYTVIYQMPSELLCDKIEQEQNAAYIEQALQKVFGMSLKIRCRTGKRQAENQTDEVEDLLATDSLTAYAVNKLGGVVKNIENDEE